MNSQELFKASHCPFCQHLILAGRDKIEFSDSIPGRFKKSVCCNLSCPVLLQFSKDLNAIELRYKGISVSFTNTVAEMKTFVMQEFVFLHFPLSHFNKDFIDNYASQLSTIINFL